MLGGTRLVSGSVRGSMAVTIGQLLASGRLVRNSIGRLERGIRTVLCLAFLDGSLCVLLWISGWFVRWTFMCEDRGAILYLRASSNLSVVRGN